jgi:hypothetical protein
MNTCVLFHISHSLKDKFLANIISRVLEVNARAAKIYLYLI